MSKLESCFAFTVMRPDTEGGARFSNDPRDPGGATKYGVSLKHCRDQIGDLDHDGDIDADDVLMLTEADALRIFGKGYFTPMHGDELPAPIALMAVDFAYNSGKHQATKSLQHVLGCTADGVLGPKTLTAARTTPLDSFISAYGAARLTFLRSLPGWATFGNGWNTRVHVCMTEARKLITEIPS